ncbi:MAG: sulfurtransferase [Proteobacteria bacterium]|nr:sulfurtransferase [Pseudomonadota bacterium]MBU1611132.1 sulfurtransferase [Pseudomonadota bacterium]
MKDIAAEDARELLAKTRSGNMTVLDVRQDWEYEEFHLPGALLIPLPEIADRWNEIDSEKPVLAYCRSGNRSRAASTFLESLGLTSVQNLLGGITAWNGDGAFGPVQGGMERLLGIHSEGDVLLIGYGMEEFLHYFYRRMGSDATTDDARELYDRLAGLEDHHMDSIYARYSRSVHALLDRDAFGKTVQFTVAEGGVDPDTFVADNAKSLNTTQDIVSMAMMFEAQALDFYMRAARLPANAEFAELLTSLAREEQAHLKVLGVFLDKRPLG